MANITRVAAAGILTGLLSGTPALAQEESLREGDAWEEDAWDSDGDGLLSYEEFEPGFLLRVDFQEWDLDDDGLLSEDEFLDAVYSRYDLDATGAFEETEYGALGRDFAEGGVWRHIGDEVIEDEIIDKESEDDLVEGAPLNEVEVPPGLEPWDIDGDGVLLRDEFEEGLRGWGTFATFDADLDGFVTPKEFAASIFYRYDADGTGLIEEPELTDIGDDMGDGGPWDP